MIKPELANAEIAVYAIYRLGGNDKKIHTEHIAMECFQLAKERFSWRLPEYMDYPDKQHVREALKDAQYFKDGSLITGRSGVDVAGKEADGWMLTPKGARWILENCKKIESLLKISKERSKRIDLLRAVKWFEKEQCYQKYLQEGSLKNVSEYEFKDMLLCRPDAHPQVIRREFERMQTKAEITQDGDILSFIKACEGEFGYLMMPIAIDEEQLR